MTGQQPNYIITEDDLDEYERRYPKPSPTPMYERTRSRPAPQTDALAVIVEKMIKDRSLCEEQEVKLTGASATYYGSRAACLDHYIEFIEQLRQQHGGEQR